MAFRFHRFVALLGSLADDLRESHGVQGLDIHYEIHFNKYQKRWDFYSASKTEFAAGDRRFFLNLEKLKIVSGDLPRVIVSELEWNFNLLTHDYILRLETDHVNYPYDHQVVQWDEAFPANAYTALRLFHYILRTSRDPIKNRDEAAAELEEARSHLG